MGKTNYPAERFVLELRHEAHRMLPPDHAEQVVMEAQWHLEESVYGGAMAGKSPDAAARDAIAGFGPPRQFVRRVAEAAIDTRVARVARAVMLCLTLFLLVGWPLALQLDLITFMGAGVYGVGIAALIGITIASFVGRRAQTRSLLVSGASIIVALSLFFAVDSVEVLEDHYISTTSRLRMPDVTERLRVHREIVADARALLTLGVQAAREGEGRIPEALNFDGTMLRPKNLPDAYGFSAAKEIARMDSPFRPNEAPSVRGEYSAAGMRQYAQSLAKRRPADYTTTTNIGEGWAAWRKYGNVWRQGQNQALKNLNSAIQAREDILARPVTPNPTNAVAAAKWLSLILLTIVGANFIAASAGRLCVYQWRQWLWRLRTA